MKKTLLAVTLGVLLTTAAFAGHHGWKYRFYKEPHADKVTIQVMWVDSEEEAIKRCGGAGCMYRKLLPDGRVDQSQTHLMLVPRPRGFNDHRRLEIMGHELLHALGADHD